MGWKIFYDAIFEREIERLDKIIESEKGEEKYSTESFRGHKGIARAKARNILFKVYNTMDFWVEDLIEPGEGLSRINTLKYLTEALYEHAGKGILKDYLPSKWINSINTNLKNLSESMKKFSKNTEDFARYIRGWSEMKLEDSVQVEVRKHWPEAYAILFGLHGSVRDIGDEEYESYVEKIKRGEHALPNIIDFYVKNIFPIDLLALIDARSLKTFLENYLAQDEFDWKYRVYPKIQNGLKVLAEFLLKKGKELRGPKDLVDLHAEKLINEWKKDLKNFQAEALMNYSYNTKARSQLADKYEYGIETKRV
jgi:hypothetical protein